MQHTSRQVFEGGGGVGYGTEELEALPAPKAFHSGHLCVRDTWAMTVDVGMTTLLVTNDSSSESLDGLDSVHDAIELAEAMMALLGILGNFLTFKAAEFLPQTNSSVLLKYLAVWDTAFAIHLAFWSFSRSFAIKIIDRNVTP